MALHSRDAVTVSEAVATRSRADCSSMEGHTSLSTALLYNLNRVYYINVWCSLGCRVGVGWGRLGVCGWLFRPCGVWMVLELSCLETLMNLELEGSRENILYDEINIMI